MSLVSLAFIGFVAAAAVIYYLLPTRARPYIILAANAVFYLSFDKRYAVFLAFSVLSAYFAALILEKKRSKAIVAVFLFLNIGLLVFVKFFGWTASLADRYFGSSISSLASGVIVPVGISFYTLQISSYVIDVYKGKYAAQKNPFKFAAFATFFPLMIQGPISRYDKLSQTLFGSAKFDADNVSRGAMLMIWGFFKKLVIADRAAMAANALFGDPSSAGGVAAIIGILAYTVQIYTDFSGCTDICRGAAKILGIEIENNFSRPYFSLSVKDFWRRWHISLSSWLRDYIYIPLGGSRKGKFRKYLNVVCVFFVSGLWHGTGFHFIVWGLLQAFFQIAGDLTEKPKKALCSKLKIEWDGRLARTWRRAVTFVLVNISWVFFRADSTVGALVVLRRVFSQSTAVSFIDYPDLLVLFFALLALFFVSFYQHGGYRFRDGLMKAPIPIRWTLLLGLLAVILIFGVYGPGYESSSFIYMNF